MPESKTFPAALPLEHNLVALGRIFHHAFAIPRTADFEELLAVLDRADLGAKQKHKKPVEP